MFSELFARDDYVSRDLPYRRWFKEHVMFSLFNVAVGCWCLTLALTVEHDWSRAIFLFLAVINFFVAAYMVIMGRKWLRKARLQEAGQVTYPHIS